METCQRCGEDGQDRRTLEMGCWYDMSELDVPFEPTAIKGKHMKLGRTESTIFGPVRTFVDDPDAKEQQTRLYTLRVCKSCRADWMQAIESWFKNIDLTGEDGVPGVYVRDKGTNRLMTQDEINRRFNNG
jgi:hypothetical protein